jgi:hypothetical protein
MNIERPAHRSCLVWKTNIQTGVGFYECFFQAYLTYIVSTIAGHR